MITGTSNIPQPGGTHPCPRDGSAAKLIVDFSRKRKPVRDQSGNLQYYCLVCHLRFSVNQTGQVVTNNPS